MTDLFDRMFPDPDDQTTQKIPIHPFRAGLDDYAAGYTTRAQIIAGFNMDAEATADLDVLLGQINTILGGPNPVVNVMRWMQEFESVCRLCEDDLKYTTKGDFATRLGL